jgi:hypothetical protein
MKIISMSGLLMLTRKQMTLKLVPYKIKIVMIYEI